MKEKVYRYRAIERAIAKSRPGARILDVGCGRGDNLRRLQRYGGRAHGIDPNVARLREARASSPATLAAAGVGEALPHADNSFEMIYISHVLHHARDVDATLAECLRVLEPGGVLFVIETVDDSPLMRLARALQPSWEDDEVLNRFRYPALATRIERAGFRVERGATFNWMYFAWELLPLAFRPFELFTPLFIGIERLGSPFFDRWGGHCWLVARKPGAALFELPAQSRREPRGPGQRSANTDAS